MMFVKEIFSLEKKKLTEIVNLKRFNNTRYEKSYVRGTLSNSDRICLLDNSSLVFNKKKDKHPKSSPAQLESREHVSFQGIKIYDLKQNKKIVSEDKGSSIYTTTFLYKNRKNNFLRFNLPSCTLNISKHTNIVSSYIENMEALVDTAKVEFDETTLIFLFASKGGFICLSSGFIGFMPKLQFKMVVLEWAENFTNFFNRSNMSDLKNFLKLQKYQVSVSPPPRFCFFLEKMSTTIVLKRNRFLLSRKKRSYVTKNFSPSFIFYSVENYRTFWPRTGAESNSIKIPAHLYKQLINREVLRKEHKKTLENERKARYQKEHEKQLKFHQERK